MRIQFQREAFESIPPAPPHDQKPLKIMFAGRINRNKGVFDILDIASAIEVSAPGSVAWEICGAGPDLDELKAHHRAMNLLNIVYRAFARGVISTGANSAIMRQSIGTLQPGSATG
jgi:glycosyltransferase involved in cell wall biosynthesis